MRKLLDLILVVGLGLCLLNALPNLISTEYPLPISAAYWCALGLLVLSIVCYFRHWKALYQGFAIVGILLLTVVFTNESIAFDSPGMLRIPVVITSTLGGRMVQTVVVNLIPGVLAHTAADSTSIVVGEAGCPGQ